jgi:two-component system sensor histidine kinase BaeS
VKLKFRHKVFLTFLLNSLAIVISMLLIAGYFAFRNFEAYVNKVETARLDELVEALSQEYKKSRSWTPILDDLGHWLQMTGIRRGYHPIGGVSGEPPFPPPPPLLPVPPEPGNPRKGEPAPFSKPPLPPPGPLHDQILLFDAEKRPLTGTEPVPADVYQMKPIHSDGRVVGWLGVRRHERPTHPLDLEFLRLQSQTFCAMGGVALFLALLVTFVLSRHLLAPVKELAQGARALTSRRFDTRIEIRSKDELGQLAADFNAMAQALERYEQMRRQWMADISHELRTPLAILRCEIEAMQDGLRDIGRETLESLHFEVLHVSRIVHDLHDLSLIESQPFYVEKTPVHPLEVLEETLKSFHTRFEQRGIGIEAQRVGNKEIAIMADGGRLTQLFSNLLENTLRYANAPGVLKISHELTNGGLSLYFEDSGPGVPEESLELLFDRLYRVDKARSRAQGGSGLGLAICRSIVERFGGKIEASNGSSGGLRISIYFAAVQASS